MPQAGIVLNMQQIITSYGIAAGHMGHRQGPVIRQLRDELDGGTLYAVVTPPPRYDLGFMVETARQAGIASTSPNPGEGLDLAGGQNSSVLWVAAYYNLPPYWPSMLVPRAR